MARIRTIKPEFWRDEDLSSISVEASLLAIGLLNVADDEGYFNANHKLIEADVFPLRELSVSIHELLSELSKIGYITIYDGSDGKKYGHVTNFSKHQKVNRSVPSKIKDLIQFTEDSVSHHGALTAGKEGNRERKGKEQGKESSCCSEAEQCVETEAPQPEETQQQQKLRSVIFSKRSELIRVTSVTEERFDGVAEHCIAHYHEKPFGADAYAVALKWFRRERKPPDAKPREPTQQMSKTEQGFAVLDEMRRNLENEQQQLVDQAGSTGRGNSPVQLSPGELPISGDASGNDAGVGEVFDAEFYEPG